MTHTVPYNELILSPNKNAVYLIYHPIDLRDKLQYKRIGDSFFRDATRIDYDYIKERSTTLIHYED